MSNTDEKIKIIDEISQRHPSLGTDKGWSQYTGGMMDSGNWFFRKMLNESIEELQSFLDELIQQENKAKIPKEYTEQEKIDMNIWHVEGNMVYTEYHKKQFLKFHKEIEQKLIWGK